MSTTQPARFPAIVVECLDFVRAEIRHQRSIVAQAPTSIASRLAEIEGVPESEIEAQCMAWVHGRGAPHNDGLRNAPVARLVRAGILEMVEQPRAKGPAFRLYRMAPGLQP